MRSRPQLARVAELLDADDHPFVPGRGLGAVGAEEAVPPGEVEAEIAVGLARHDRMVHAVHVRRDHEPAQHAVEPRRQADVAVVEHRGGVEQDLEDQHAPAPARRARRPRRA